MRPTLSVLAACAVLAGPAAAQDGFTFDSQAEFEAAVRAYLLDQPEVLLEAMQVLESREAQARADADAQLLAINADAIFNGGDWIGGNPDGDITLVEFIDYRCGYCKRARPEVNALVEADGNIRLIRKELPVLGAQSEAAARFAIATRTIAGDAAYVDVSDALMAMRSDGDITQDLLEQLADAYDLDSAAIIAEMDSDATEAVIRNTHMLAMRLHIQGTPAFVMENMFLRGYLPLTDMQDLVAAQRQARQ